MWKRITQEQSNCTIFPGDQDNKHCEIHRTTLAKDLTSMAANHQEQVALPIVYPINIPLQIKSFVTVIGYVCHHCQSRSVRIASASIFTPIGDFFKCDDCGEMWLEPNGCIQTDIEIGTTIGEGDVTLGVLTSFHDTCPGCGSFCSAWEFTFLPRRFSSLKWCVVCAKRWIFITTFYVNTQGNVLIPRMSVLRMAN
jgi:hypothetical protein